MPMPEMQRHIYLRYRDVSDGFGSYSDGVHDDLNKMLWSAYGWDPETDLDAFLAEYGNVFFGGTLATEVAQGLRMLERNWHGPILENQGIPATRDHWSASPRVSDSTRTGALQMQSVPRPFRCQRRRKRAPSAAMNRRPMRRLYRRHPGRQRRH